MDLIHSAASWGLQKMVAQLVEEDSSLLNAANEQGWTSLMLAASRGHFALVKYLIQQGACIDADDQDGFTALTHAACGRKGRKEVVALLLRHGANPNAKSRWGSTVMMEASSLDFVERIQCLLDHGKADLNARDEKGSTALFKACLFGRYDSCKLLLNAGADPTLANEEGLSPLLAALSIGPRGIPIAHLLERALMEPWRARLLHQVRALNDATHAIAKAAAPFSSSSSSTSSLATTTKEEEERRQQIKCLLAAAPDYLKGRVAQGEKLPMVTIDTSPQAATILAASSPCIGAGGEGGSSRRNKRKRRHPESFLYKEEVADMAYEQEKGLAVVEYVCKGGLAKELFGELMDFLVVKWDPSRRRREREEEEEGLGTGGEEGQGGTCTTVGLWGIRPTTSGEVMKAWMDEGEGGEEMVLIDEEEAMTTEEERDEEEAEVEEDLLSIMMGEDDDDDEEEEEEGIWC